MNENEILDKIRHARKLVESVEDPYKIPSFQVILAHLLEKPSKKIEPELKPSKEKSPIPSRISLPELIKIVNPKSFPEKTLLMGYYLLKYKESEIFNINDFDNSYSLARMRKPKNQNDVVNSLIEKGFFADAGQKKRWIKSVLFDSFRRIGNREINPRGRLRSWESNRCSLTIN